MRFLKCFLLAPLKMVAACVLGLLIGLAAGCFLLAIGLGVVLVMMIEWIAEE